MTFFARTQPIVLIKQATRATTPYASRTFTTSVTQQKGVVDSAKDALKAVDRKVSDKLVDGIEVSETVAKKTKEVTGLENAGAKASQKLNQAEAGAAQTLHETEGSASQMAGQAKGKASQMAGQVKGKANEMGGDLKGKAAEVEGAAKGRSNELHGTSGTAKPGVKGM